MIELTIQGQPGTARSYIGWAPVEAQIRLAAPSSDTSPTVVTLRNARARVGGQVVFTDTPGATPTSELTLSLPANGTPVDFRVGGEFGRPSSRDEDAAIQVRAAGSGQPLTTKRLMVRIRKNATTLSLPERNRFVAAFAMLNSAGAGRFSDFRNIHTEAGSLEAHGNAGFLPWHRAYLLDLERELQAIDPSVALPYWRFDRPAPRVFTRSFMGVPDAATGALRFSAGNMLQTWSTDGVVGIVRRPNFNTRTQAARVIDEATTLALGGRTNVYAGFIDMEGDPHASAHSNFSGFISNIHTAARDPLFFLLHANVDRLWAKWQWFNRRFDSTRVESYSFPGRADQPRAARPGHNREDTMWPWNRVTAPPRPPTAPGGDFPMSPLVPAPGNTPTVGSMVDYQGVLVPSARLGFDYDDVPFEP